MSRISDVQGILRGLGRIGSCSCQRNVKEVSNIYQNIYIQPVVNQAIRIVLDIKDPVTVDGGKEIKSKEKTVNKGLEFNQVMDNIPTVIQGMGIFANLMVTGNYSMRTNKVDKPNLVNTSDDKILNTNVSALDLLEVDITDKELLKEKIFLQNIKTEPVPEEDVSKEMKKNKEDLTNMNKLNTIARERSVPSSRISRVASFASLGVGLGLGIVAEASRRVVGVRPTASSGAKTDGSMILTEANAERIVATLCRVRGAALKLGQMLSIQDGAVVGPELQKIFDRVRESADFMPEWQLEKVMVGELGDDWRDKFKKFNIRPFAAASIGQVHYAEMHDGSSVAVKVQYPGVAKSIDSDIRNLISLVSMLAILPKGLFLDNIANHMKVELAEECDYV